MAIPRRFPQFLRMFGREFRDGLNWICASLVFAAGLCLLATPGYAVCQLVAENGYRDKSVDDLIRPAALKPDQVQIRYLGHSTFEIVTPQGIRIATDYNDRYRPAVTPTVATMNGAHATHFTYNPDPGIKHLLFGWNPEGGPIDHDVMVGDVRVRNIQTNIRGWDGTTRKLGNSIFVFEVADLCIAHLGHLHHRLTEEDLFRLGQIDIVFAAIDNSSTLRLASMMQVLADIKPALIVPMHFHFHGALPSFLAQAASDGYAIQTADSPILLASRATLPTGKTIYVMQPEQH